MKRVAVVGLGKAGLPLAAVMASSGVPVVGIDLDAKRCERIKNGENPIPEEPGLGEILKSQAGKNLICTSSYTEHQHEIDHYVVIVPLFIHQSGPNKNKPDFSILDKAFHSIKGVLKTGDCVVLETTVPPGTVEGRFKPILDQAGVDYCLGYSPERIMTGYSISRYRDFPKVVSGMNQESLDRIEALYSRFCKSVVPVASTKTAEFVKVCEGVFRDVNIALANEIRKVCEAQQISFPELQAAANHAYCNIHTPGIVGGHCIPVYPYFFLETYPSKLIAEARRINESMIDLTIERMGQILKRQNKTYSDASIAFLGITYREGVISLYNSPALYVLEGLKDKKLQIDGWDPLLSKEEIKAAGLNSWRADKATAYDCYVVFHQGAEIESLLKRLHHDGGPPIQSRLVDLKDVWVRAEL